MATEQETYGSRARNMDPLAAIGVPKPDPTDKIFVISIIIFVLLLSAVCAGIPSPDPYDQTGNPAQLAVNNGDR
jgi:hypothetical protein